MSYFYLNQIITSTLTSKREYIINSTYHSTGKNITGKILIKEKYERYIIA